MNKKILHKRRQRKRYNKSTNRQKREATSMVEVNNNVPDFIAWNTTRQTLVDAVEEEIGHLCESFELGDSVDVIDILVKPITPEVRKHIREFYETRHILMKIEGSKERILYPYKGKNYYVDLTFGSITPVTAHKTWNDKSTQPAYITDAMSASTTSTGYTSASTTSTGYTYKSDKTVALRCIMSQMAHSLGYSLDTNNSTLSLNILCRDGKESPIVISTSPQKILEILKLGENVENVSSPESFAEWVLSSTRYDSALFSQAEPNEDDKKAGEENDFTKQVYTILHAIEVTGEIGPTVVDMRDENLDIEKAIALETQILGKVLEERIKKVCEAIERFQSQHEKDATIITGKTLQRLGYESGPIYKEIMRDVAEKFTDESKHSDVIEYVREHYPISNHGTTVKKQEEELLSVVRDELSAT